MSRTTFSGPVVSTGGFIGNVTGNVTGTVTGTVNGTLEGFFEGNATCDLVETQALRCMGDAELDGKSLILLEIPTSDPLILGQVWANNGVLTISSGE